MPGKSLENMHVAVLAGGHSAEREISLNSGKNVVVHSVDEALAAVADELVAWVIGGGDVYRQFLPYCVEAEVTHNHCVHPVDTYFPDLDADPAWEIAQRSGVATIAAGEGDEGVNYEFVTYRRIEA